MHGPSPSLLPTHSLTHSLTHCLLVRTCLQFICFFQQFTILAFTAPIAACYASTKPLGPWDAAAALLFAALVLGETLADAQMYAFQTEKYRRKNAGEDLGPYKRGFIETGLWAYSRHPNYFCEVSIWWSYYLFTVGITGTFLNPWLWGPIFLTLLFVPPGASLDTTEAISIKKYPAYAEYQARVSRFIPWFPASTKGGGGGGAGASGSSSSSSSSSSGATADGEPATPLRRSARLSGKRSKKAD